MKKIISPSLADTEKVAADLATTLKGGDVVCLYGDLGAGKTAFTKALGKAMGVTETVTSPTFVLMNQYAVHLAHGEAGTLYHLDAYRLSSSSEALDLGLTDIWADPTAIMVIEWADRIAEILPEKRIDIRFHHDGTDGRIIDLEDNR